MTTTIKNIRFSQKLRAWSSLVFAVLLVSGLLWLPLKYTAAGPWLLKIHGGAAMAALMLFGVMVPIHMQPGWQQDRNRKTAVFMVTVCLSMIASGYGLYYCGSEELRPWISGFHIASGCAFPLVLIWHIFVGRRWKITRFIKPRPAAHKKSWSRLAAPSMN